MARGRVSWEDASAADHERGEQPATGGASGQQGMKPYSDSSSKVRWMALSGPHLPSSQSIASQSALVTGDLEVPQPPLIEPAGSPSYSSFDLALQNVTTCLEELKAVHWQELVNLRAENLSLNSQLQNVQDSSPDVAGYMAQTYSARDDVGNVSVPAGQMGESESAEVAQFDDSDLKASTQLNNIKRDLDTSLAKKREEEAGVKQLVTSKSNKSVLARSQSSSGFSMSFELRRAWHQDIEEWCEDIGPVPSMKIQAVGSRVASILRSEKSMPVNTKGERRRPFMIFHPIGAVRLSWNVLCLLAICYDIIFVPLEAFEMEAFAIIDAVEWMLTILWTCDVFVTLRTAYFVGSTLETEWHHIAIHYAKTWLAVDLTIITLEWLARLSDAATGFGSILRTSRVFRTLRCIRLLRLGKLKGLLTVVEDQINSGLASLVFSLLKLVVFLVIMVHAITCVWYAVGNSQPDGWVTYYAPSVEGYRGLFFWYFASSRWTLAQINGRTDMDERRNIVELGWTCLVAIGFAVVFMALFISSITTTMMELSSIAESKFNTQRMVGEYMAGNYVSARLVGSVKRHIKELQGVEDESTKERKILMMLPRQMANDLLYEVRAPTLSRNNFFENMNTDFPRVLRHVCHKAVSTVAAHRWEVVFDKGDACSRMLFVDKGEIMYSEGFIKWQPDFRDLDIGPPGEALRRGAWVSEAALWIEWRNQGKLTAATHSSLLGLEAHDFAVVLEEYKDCYTRAVLYAAKFVQELIKLDKMSDMISIEKAITAEEAASQRKSRRKSESLGLEQYKPGSNTNLV